MDESVTLLKFTKCSAYYPLLPLLTQEGTITESGQMYSIDFRPGWYSAAQHGMVKDRNKSQVITA